MRGSLLVLAPTLVLALALHATAEIPSASDGAAAVEAVETPGSAIAPQPDEASGLGPVGYDAEGRPGRIHVVRKGDTLWDLSDAYLGTPWVWPSIWKDNPDVANPHLIYPGDRIWITPHEMRRVTPEEAEQLLAARPASEPPASPPAAFDRVAEDEAARPAAVRLVSSLEGFGLVTAEELEAAAAIVDSSVGRTWLAQGDPVYVGLGEGETRVGERFTIVRPGETVSDPETGASLGVFVETLGWLQIVAVHAESATAEIRSSNIEMGRGDRLLPRRPRSQEIAVGRSPAGLEGSIAFLPDSRTLMASEDVVYLNRGTDHGLAVGSPLEVYRPGQVGEDVVRDLSVKLPDEVVARMLVVDARPQTAVAVVTGSHAELLRGDRFRASSQAP